MAVHPLVLDSKDLRILEEEGDAVALETLYRNYATPLLKFCQGRLATPQKPRTPPSKHS